MECCKQIMTLILIATVIDMTLSSEWSTCSRTCGIGIKQRTAPCQNVDCDQTKLEFRVCSLKKCPDSNADFRSEQCRAFGEDMVPFIDESDPCKLMCSPQGKHPEEKGTVVDGTPCLSGGVCVGGNCVCSDECIKEVQGVNTICRDRSGNPINKLNCSSLTEKSNYIWIESKWTKCSVTCGRGSQTRNVSCTKDGRIVNESLCNIHYKPSKIKACQGPRCEGRWIARDWLEQCVAPRCHAAGKQYRSVYCVYNGMSSLNYHFVKCNLTTKPANVRGCYWIKGCSPEWKGLEWSPCNAPCDGTQNRKIICILGNETLPDERCPAEKPSIIQTCGLECRSFKICDNEFCHLDNLESCPKECCRSCKEKHTGPGWTPQLWYKLCEKSCCRRCPVQF